LGVCVCSAEALQSLLQLLGEKDLYDYHRDTYKVHGVDWTVDKARQVLDAWRRKFTQVSLHFYRAASIMHDVCHASAVV